MAAHPAAMPVGPHWGFAVSAVIILLVDSPGGDHPFVPQFSVSGWTLLVLGSCDGAAARIAQVEPRCLNDVELSEVHHGSLGDDDVIGPRVRDTTLCTMTWRASPATVGRE